MYGPKPRRLPSGRYFIQIVLNGVSVPVTADTVAECIRHKKAALTGGLDDKNI